MRSSVKKPTVFNATNAMSGCIGVVLGMQTMFHRMSGSAQHVQCDKCFHVMCNVKDFNARFDKLYIFRHITAEFCLCICRL